MIPIDFEKEGLKPDGNFGKPEAIKNHNLLDVPVYVTVQDRTGQATPLVLVCHLHPQADLGPVMHSFLHNEIEKWWQRRGDLNNYVRSVALQDDPKTKRYRIDYVDRTDWFGSLVRPPLAPLASTAVDVRGTVPGSTERHPEYESYDSGQDCLIAGKIAKTSMGIDEKIRKQTDDNLRGVFG